MLPLPLHKRLVLHFVAAFIWGEKQEKSGQKRRQVPLGQGQRRQNESVNSEFPVPESPFKFWLGTLQPSPLPPALLMQSPRSQGLQQPEALGPRRSLCAAVQAVAWPAAAACSVSSARCVHRSRTGGKGADVGAADGPRVGTASLWISFRRRPLPEREAVTHPAAARLCPPIPAWVPLGGTQNRKVSSHISRGSFTLCAVTKRLVRFPSVLPALRADVAALMS